MLYGMLKAAMSHAARFNDDDLVHKVYTVRLNGLCFSSVILCFVELFAAQNVCIRGVDFCYVWRVYVRERIKYSWCEGGIPFLLAHMSHTL
jgi:hypothetical protein